jgi:Holliday junction resolvase RusA-like endonuclease
MLLVRIPGRPISKANTYQIVAHRRTGKLQLARAERARAYQERAVLAFRQAALLREPPVRFASAEPVVVLVVERVRGRRVPDIDGPLKAILDAAQQSGVLANDRQVVMLLVWRESIQESQGSQYGQGSQPVHDDQDDETLVLLDSLPRLAKLAKLTEGTSLGRSTSLAELSPLLVQLIAQLGDELGAAQEACRSRATPMKSSSAS